MSAGEFVRTFYQLDTGNGAGIVRARVQPETLAASIAATPNAGAVGPATVPITAKASGGNSEFGVNMRSVTLAWTGTIPANYSGDPVTIPVLQESTYAAWTIGATGTYLTEAVEVVGRSPERVN